MFCFKRLGDIVVCTPLHAVEGGVDVAVSAHHDDGAVEGFYVRLVEKGQAVHIWHTDVGEDDVELLFAERL